MGLKKDAPTLYVLSGYPYSGKTSLAQLIAERRGYTILAFDWIWHEKKPDTVPMMNRLEEWDEIYTVAIERIRTALIQGHSVVFDDISNRKWSDFRKLAHDCAAEFKIIYLNIPLEEVKRRRDHNLQTKERHHVDDENFFRAVQEMQIPHGREVIEFRFGENAESLIKKL